MPVKLVPETWKRRKKPRDLDHRRLNRRLSSHERMLHMMHCGMCLESAIAAAESVMRQVKPFIEEYERYGTVGGRVYPHHPLKGSDARARGEVGRGTDS